MPTPAAPLPIALAGKIGPPLFTATFVHCLLAADLAPSHLILIGSGLALMIVEHLHAGSLERRHAAAKD